MHEKSHDLPSVTLTYLTFTHFITEIKITF
jgi:hypothetical protein